MTHALHLNNKQKAISKLTENTLPTQYRYQLDNIFRNLPVVWHNLGFIQNAENKVFLFERRCYIHQQTYFKVKRKLNPTSITPEDKGRKPLRNIDKKITTNTASYASDHNLLKNNTVKLSGFHKN